MQLHLPPLPGTSSTGTGTPAREADTRELRDFWKQYMRTPLTGPEGMAPTPGVSGVPGSRKRVASLPSAKTPVVERQSLYAPPAPPLAGASRTAVHAGEDLRSYEAAVMARKAPVTLNLQARRTQKARAQAPGPVSGSLIIEIGLFVLTRCVFISNTASAPLARRVPHPVRRPRRGARTHSVWLRPRALQRTRHARHPYRRKAAQVVVRVMATRRDRRSSGFRRRHSAPQRRSARSLVLVTTTSACQAGASALVRRPVRVNPPAEGGASAYAPALSGVPGGAMNLSHPDRVVASLAERRRRRMSAPSASFGLLEPDHGHHVSISHSSRGSQEQSAQRQQGQQDYHDKQGSMSGRDMPATYAPAGPGGI